jgi:hypothetical protein
LERLVKSRHSWKTTSPNSSSKSRAKRHSSTSSGGA